MLITCVVRSDEFLSLTHRKRKFFREELRPQNQAPEPEKQNPSCPRNQCVTSVSRQIMGQKETRIPQLSSPFHKSLPGKSLKHVPAEPAFHTEVFSHRQNLQMLQFLAFLHPDQNPGRDTIPKHYGKNGGTGASSHFGFGVVNPAHAGIQCTSVDCRLRGNDTGPRS
jgi:hypothetical protein